jgi:hypothetical protein
VTSLSRIYPETSNIDDEVGRWLADLDPEGTTEFHDRVIGVVADAAIRFDKKLNMIPAQDGANATLAWIAGHPEKLRQWSSEDRDTGSNEDITGLMVWMIRNKISSAARSEHGDHKVTIDGNEFMIYTLPETPLSELAEADALAVDDGKPRSLEDAVNSRLGSRAHVPSAEDAYFVRLDGPTSETPNATWAPVPYKVKIGREYVDDSYPVPLSKEGRLELPLMTRALYRAQRVALGALSPHERRLLEAHHGEDVPLRVLVTKVGSTKEALGRRFRRLRRKIRDLFEAKFSDLSGSAPIGQVLELGGRDTPPDDYERSAA